MQMPVVDGPAFVAAYHRRPPPRAPIVGMAAATAGLAAAQSLGIAAALAKPFEIDELLTVVALLLAQRESSAA
jgi:CheY-like chemotaxis protein